jgi:hypothetical protein
VRKTLSFSKSVENHIGAIWYFINLIYSGNSLSVGDIIDVRPGVWISVGGLLGYKNVLGIHFGTLVLQIHSEDSPNPEQNDPSFRLWMFPSSQGRSTALTRSNTIKETLIKAT